MNGSERSWVLTVVVYPLLDSGVPAEITHKFMSTGSPTPRHSDGTISWHATNGDTYGFNSGTVMRWTLERAADD